MTQQSNTWKPNNKGVRDFLVSRKVAEATLKIAEKIAAIGKANSPIDTGEYQRSWYAKSVPVTVRRETRAGAEVGNSAGYAAAIEWGYSGRRDEEGPHAHHVFAKAIEAMRID